MEQGNKYDYNSSHRYASWWVLQASYTPTLHHVYPALNFKPQWHGIRLTQVISFRHSCEVGLVRCWKEVPHNSGAYHFGIDCPHILSRDTARHICQIPCLSWGQLGWCILGCVFGLNKRPCLQINGLIGDAPQLWSDDWHFYFDICLSYEQSEVSRRSQ